VGLAREEFILSSSIGIHPLALLEYDKLKARAEAALRRAQEALPFPDPGETFAQDQEAPRSLKPASLPFSEEERELWEVVKAIERKTAGYIRKADFFVDELARGIARIAAAFYREEDGKVKGDVIVRLTDFKSNEYRSLIGGKLYEPLEQNPMLGWRGASRYYHPLYEPAFALECQALKKVRDEMGLVNVKVMVPFCRTVEEGRRVIETMAKYGLVRGENGLEVYVMAEIPSNVILADEFARIFDGFSIGSNDLTQLTLGLDRDSELVQYLYDERNEAVKRLLAQMLKAAKGHRPRRKTGICGQAPSDFPSVAAFLVEHGIDSMAVNTDTVVNTRILVYFAELAKEEGKRLVYTEEQNGKIQVKLGVSPTWLKAKAERWIKAHVQRAQDLPRKEQAMIATLLHAMAPKVQLDHPGGIREILCWRIQDVDVAKEERARGIKTVDVRLVGSLTARGIVRKAEQWLEQAEALDQKVTLLENPVQVKELIKKFDEAHREFLSQKFTDLILEMYQNEVKKT
ncbi:MAG: putative PEP-binding protein, partial [Candidatus Methylomirabilales bacterium]